MYTENKRKFTQRKIKNVLIVSMTEFFGGGESYIMNLVDVISKQHRVYLLVSSKDLYHRLKGASFIMQKKWSGYSCYLSYVIAVCGLIKANKIDIIILNGQREIYLSVFLRLFFRLKIISIRHTEFFCGETWRERIRDYLFKLSTLFADQVICVSKNVYNQLERIYKLNKVAIVDFDVHHGNGTQDIFYDNEKVLYISTHQYPFYPGTGGDDERGKYNNIFNVPLPAGTTSEKYLSAYEFVLKKLKEFKPEFILFSAGFDAHENDPLAQFQLKSKDFYELTKRTLSLAKSCCNGKVVSILEGGYDLNALKESVDYHVKSLLE